MRQQIGNCANTVLLLYITQQYHVMYSTDDGLARQYFYPLFLAGSSSLLFV